MRKRVYLSISIAAGCTAALTLFATPAQADGLPANITASAISAGEPANSRKLRRLDIMLMVTALRCRTTPNDFQADFQAFEARHLTELNAAARVMVENETARLGVAEANRELDRASVRMANQYGNGHPWLGCRALKNLATELAHEDGRDMLLQAAGEIFEDDGPPLMVSPAPALAETPQTEGDSGVSLAAR